MNLYNSSYAVLYALYFVNCCYKYCTLIFMLIFLGEAGAIMAKALARAQALEILGKAIGKEHGSKAASLSVAEQYVQAFSQLAKTSNTLLLPEKTGDVGSMVAQVRFTR